MQRLLRGGNNMNKKDLKNTLLIASFLLQYPDINWCDTLCEVQEEINKVKDETYIKPMLRFLEYAGQNTELDLAELYVHTFDFDPKTSLYLTYYRFDEQKERGAALLKIKQRYGEAGLHILKGELPDFLPILLEFSAVSGEKELLEDYADVIQDIYYNLSKANNPYSEVLKSVLLLIGVELEAAALINTDPSLVYTSLGGDGA
jgi:nitrate reductase molybdenum cofactor assembly chaperone NarJ/NarW